MLEQRLLIWKRTDSQLRACGVNWPSPFARTAYSIMGRVAAAMRDAGIDQREIRLDT